MFLFAVMVYSGLKIVQLAAKGETRQAKKYVIGAVVSSLVIVWFILFGGYAEVAIQSAKVMDILWSSLTSFLG